VSGNTVVYVGPLYPNIFKQLPQNIEHVYTKFPEGKILIKEIEIFRVFCDLLAVHVVRK
jgi:hypothetical protein